MKATLKGLQASQSGVQTFLGPRNAAVDQLSTTRRELSEALKRVVKSMKKRPTKSYPKLLTMNFEKVDGISKSLKAIKF